MSNVKFFKNPSRNDASEKVSQYIPEWQTHGVEPVKVPASTVLGAKYAKEASLPLSNPRSGRDIIRPESLPTIEMNAVNLSKIPNVGNLERNWLPIGNIQAEGSIIDDISGLDPKHPMIDNNEFMTDEAYNFESNRMDDDTTFGFTQSEPSEPTVTAGSTGMDLLSILSELSKDSYLLILSGTPICSGPLEEIQEQAYQLCVLGEHVLCTDKSPIPLSEIMIVKKVNVKVGLFLDEK